MRGKRRENAANCVLLLRTLPLSGAGVSPASSRVHRRRRERDALAPWQTAQVTLRLSRHPSIFHDNALIDLLCYTDITSDNRALTEGGRLCQQSIRRRSTWM